MLNPSTRRAVADPSRVQTIPTIYEITNNYNSLLHTDVFWCRFHKEFRWDVFWKSHGLYGGFKGGNRKRGKGCDKVKIIFLCGWGGDTLCHTSAKVYRVYSKYCLKHTVFVTHQLGIQSRFKMQGRVRRLKFFMLRHRCVHIISIDSHHAGLYSALLFLRG